jgi:glycine oxidase
MYSGFLRELQEDSGFRIDYRECGALDVAYSAEDLSQLESRAQHQLALGIRSKPILPGQVATFWPRIRHEGLLGGRFYPEDAIVNPRELTHALKCVCRRLWVSLCEHFRIRAIQIASGGVTFVSEYGTQGFDIGIVAAGAWSSELEVRGAPALPSAEPVKGHLIGYQQPEETCNTIVRHGPTYLLQRSNGLLIAGSSMERVGFDRDVNPLVESDLAKRAALVMPHLAETSPSESWTGFRPASNDLHIGRWHSPRLYLAYGHYRNGILLAPVTAEQIVADISANLQML